MVQPSALRLRTGLATAPPARAALAPPHASLCDALDSLLDTGIVAAGEIRIKVADIDLLYVALELVACSWETAQGLPGKAPARAAARRRARSGKA
jgi:hypothetical protein